MIAEETVESRKSKDDPPLWETVTCYDYGKLHIYFPSYSIKHRMRTQLIITHHYTSLLLWRHNSPDCFSVHIFLFACYIFDIIVTTASDRAVWGRVISIGW